MNQYSRYLIAAQGFLVILGVALGAAAFLYLRPAVGFQDPSAARIVVFHVPTAWLASIAFVASAVYAIRYLRKRRLEDDDAASASAEIGLLCAFLATVTGSIFARTQWGSWWNWDPRETSISILLIIYGAYFALRGSVPEANQRALYSAVYSLLACLVMPFLVFVAPRVMFSLHPSKAHMAPSYWVVLFAAFAGFTFYLGWLFRIRLAMGRERLAADAAGEDVSGQFRPTLVRTLGPGDGDRSNGGRDF